MKKLFILFIAVAGFVATSKAQVSETATATATIVTPITIAKTVDMNFGNVAVSASSGTVVLAPAGTRSATLGVTLPAVPGTVTAASFTVSGTSGYTYSITLPAVATIVSNGANSMTVDSWTSNPTPTGVLTGGSQTLNVGATLSVAGSQAAGVYTSATPFTVTVNYN